MHLWHFIRSTIISNREKAVLGSQKACRYVVILWPEYWLWGVSYSTTHLYLEVGVYSTSTTFLLDKLNVEIYLEFNNYSNIDLTIFAQCIVIP